MSSREELEALGYVVSFSLPCQIVAWGKWFVSVKKANGSQIMGYGDNEDLAFDEALKTVRKVA